jgi:predicted small secreted protein
MNKILIILLLCFGLSSCVTTEDVKSVSKKVSNTFSTKKVETSNNQIKEETINAKFIQWKCYEHFGDDAEHILTIGYFPDYRESFFEESKYKKLDDFSEKFLESGMIELKSTSKKCFHFTLLELLNILLYGVEKLFKIIW